MEAGQTSEGREVFYPIGRQVEVRQAAHADERGQVRDPIRAKVQLAKVHESSQWSQVVNAIEPSVEFLERFQGCERAKIRYLVRTYHQRREARGVL